MLCPQATPCCCRLLPGDSKSEAGGPRGGGQCSWQEVEWPWRGQDTGRLRHHVRSGPAEAKGERDGRAEAGEHPQTSDCCIGHRGCWLRALEPWSPGEAAYMSKQGECRELETASGVRDGG